LSQSAKAKPKYRLIVVFHGLGPVPDRIDSAERDYWCAKDKFTSILDSIYPLSQRIPIEITFDDGNMSDAVIALPALAERGLTASFFVCAGRIGLPGYLDSSAMKDIISAGMEIESHGWGHVDWRCVDDKVLDVEIDGSRKKIAEIVGYAIDKVSIPFGSYDRRVLRRLRRSEIKTVFTSDGGCAPPTGWLLPRETFRRSTWNNRTLTEIVARSFYMSATIRSAVFGLIKRLR
jgi:peptidoglycan/xylan/chitin deacetylase (PgdA/CDA1 family)